ncbi:MAG: carbohydrate binding domain-containing protein [Alloacidobacterium sp.]|jgi:tetratricopeptide (TPR) repeat protein
MARTSRQSWPQRLLLFTVCVTGVAVYTWFVVKAYRAQRLADRSDQSSIEQAVALAPRNATYRDLLCRSLIFISQEPERAVDECRKASELNPYNSSIWLDLAQAYYSVGDKQLNNAAIHKALAVDPTTPDTAWNAANFFLIQGNTSEALKQFGIVLREEPSLAAPALNICWQSLHDINRMQTILPPNPGVYLAFIRLLLSTGDLDSAHQIWSALMQLQTDIDFHQGLFYIDGLLQARLAAGASDAWKQLSSKSKALQAYSQTDNLITDGSFTQEILNSGFDWRYDPKPQIAVTLDRAEFHTGNRSLRLVYSESGSDAGIFQYIAVQPNTMYRVSAWVKSEDLETANGPTLTILGAYDNAIYGATEETIGTTPWHRVETAVQSGPETKLLILAVLRRPGETRVQGKFWIDDVKLSRF